MAMQSFCDSLSFFPPLQKEKDGRTIDNICGAACRMIIANIKLVPVGEVFPMVVSKLPLKVRSKPLTEHPFPSAEH